MLCITDSLVVIIIVKFICTVFSIQMCKKMFFLVIKKRLKII